MKYLLILCLACCTSLAHAQALTTIGYSQDPFQKNLFSADRVMEMRSELDLTDAQASKIKKIHSENAGKFSSLKWDLDEETKKLKELLDQTKIDETAVQKQMDKVLTLENSMKKQQLSTMVAIKNELSPEQQEKLQSKSVYVLRGKGFVNGTQGFSSNYGTGTTIPGSKIRIGQPSYRMTWTDEEEVDGGGSYSPKVSVMVAGTDENEKPVFYLDSKDGYKEIKDLKKIQPNQIESMEVLKGNSAIEKFGDKGKNGVIIIKLKEEPKK
ncbi:Spy/CpxP family protein refolding chaperone [Algoriphagus halophytocola]|uniref:Spy/CpxP family protein refolding chaperone n=1 Tax=Algoriphagus halophytocola TaxID=2991499 RepID=A0ABY6ME10_9BACT|nr:MULTISPECIES: Spy/CpxP family protein refolding chaperone [unclassified Algoriphagus]UZD22028.1 Spy/CpxP family protein refolding chaperone [Algoriphagus sp. TR-M5]WBL43279.1 Spy/CpxP family protein refolding chaperone [Algoriphagus sp. TR-M9]